MAQTSTPLWHALVAVSAFAAAIPAQADDSDALTLQAAPAPAAEKESPLRASIELAGGSIEQRPGDTTQNANRESIDLRYATHLSDAWRISFSDRIDRTEPAQAEQPLVLNSLREAWLGWTDSRQSTSVDFGRINFRQGPAYGYNPTDYFRTGGLRTITTADPLTLREMRMGTVMLRLGQLWSNGAATLALAPKIQTSPSESEGSPDFGATNGNDRALLTANAKFGAALSGQGSLLLERGNAPTLGANMTWLAADSVVAYGEWSSSRMRSLQAQLTNSPAAPDRIQQAALGATWTLPGTSLSLTAEAEYNGAGLDHNGWNAVMSQGAQAYGLYEATIQPGQDLGSRRAWLLYATQKGIGSLKQLDLRAFVRTNADDASRLYWAEMRYHWPRWDLALQWQRSTGSAGTEYASMPYRQVVQVLGVLYF